MHPIISEAIALTGSQAKLAELSGLSQQHISRLLNEQQNITAAAAIKIEAATGFRITRGQLCPQFWPPALTPTPHSQVHVARPARARAAR
jgi:DNA-binding transcriptional regulator YdaS (Cro superfamily)